MQVSEESRYFVDFDCLPICYNDLGFFKRDLLICMIFEGRDKPSKEGRRRMEMCAVSGYDVIFCSIVATNKPLSDNVIILIDLLKGLIKVPYVRSNHFREQGILVFEILVCIADIGIILDFSIFIQRV